MEGGIESAPFVKDSNTDELPLFKPINREADTVIDFGDIASIEH
jgi:hypothetical protein